MMDQFERTRRLLGKKAMEQLASAAVAVFGIGGVGSFTVEALARSGIGTLCLYDGDCVERSNLNRQLIATCDTIGMPKVEAARERVLQINPAAKVEAHHLFFSAETADTVDFAAFSYVVDAIDTVTSKLLLIERAKAAGVPVISCMGAGNKLDPTRFEVADIYQTSVCPLARVMRRELKQRGIDALKVVYSREEAIKPTAAEPANASRRQPPGSIAFVPSVAGLILAGEVIKDLTVRRNSE